MQYLPVDTALIGGNLKLILGQDTQTNPLIGPLPQGQDRVTSSQREGVEFQFPPRIVSDNRACNWNEAMLLAEEPLAILAQSDAREIALEWTYVVDGGTWTTQKVQDQVLKVRRYFGGLNESGPSENLIVTLRIWKLGGNTDMTFRMLSGNVKHGDVIVLPASGPDDAYPLRTDISITLKSWTSKSKVNIKALRPTTPPDWF